MILNGSHNIIGIDKAVKHNIGNGTFGFSAFLEEFNNIIPIPKMLVDKDDEQK